MPIREPRKVVVFKDDKFYHRFHSVNNTIKFLAEDLGISFASAKTKINKACREKDGYFKNFRFVKDPDYVKSRPVVATNLITGDYIFFPSVGKAGEYTFGKHDSYATVKITLLCQSGKIHDVSGLSFKYIENGYILSPRCHSFNERPIF